MNRVFSPFVKSLLTVLLAVSSFSVAAQADPARGEALYVNGDASSNITACVACHGAAGNSTIGQNPKLSAQHAAYTVKQLQDFASGARNNAVMTPIAKALSEQDMQNVAAYLSIQAAKPSAARTTKEVAELGRQIYRAGIAEKKVPACAACHGPAAAGIPNLYARLAGQHAEYTAAELVQFRNGERKNSEQMTTIAKRLSDDEIQALAHYISGLK